MVEVEHAEVINASIPLVWDFCKDMSNLVQYLKDQAGDDEESGGNAAWRIVGNVGVMARTVSFEVRINEEAEEDRVTFSMKGLSGMINGDGSALILGPIFRASVFPGRQRKNRATGAIS
ncbi:MAG: hypothetical protein FJZ95_09795 [Chloroflexi bacterium]|nr:hypothetical protein [Chloroflexota bacterium]